MTSFEQLPALAPAGLAAWAIAPQVGIEATEIGRLGSVRDLSGLPRMVAVRLVNPRDGRVGYSALSLDRFHPGRLDDRELTTLNIVAADEEGAALLADRSRLSQLRAILIVHGLINLFRGELWAADHRKTTGERIAVLSIVGPVSVFDHLRWLLPRAVVVATEFRDALAVVPKRAAPAVRHD